MQKRLAQLILVILSVAIFLPVYAQNAKLLEEEKLKDRERDKLIEEMAATRRAEEALLFEQLSEEELDKKNLVEVEYNNILPSDLTSRSLLVPYKVRRKQWGSLFTLSYLLPDYTLYDPEFSSGLFDEVYGTPGMIEAAYNVKYNMKLGAIAAEVAIGVLSASAQDGTNSDINLMQYRLGLKYTIDNYFYEPVIAPYVGGGVYMMNYKEELAADSVNGITDPALYFLFGALLQLDWVDSAAAVEAYTEGGIENTFLFLEARNYISSATAQDPDFSTEFSLAAGLSLEF